MTYTVSFFGFPWPDRVIKSRLFRWIMRGPITASITLAVTTFLKRIGRQTDIDISSLTVLGMVASIVVFEYFVLILLRLTQYFLHQCFTFHTMNMVRNRNEMIIYIGLSILEKVKTKTHGDFQTWNLRLKQYEPAGN